MPTRRPWRSSTVTSCARRRAGSRAARHPPADDRGGPVVAASSWSTTSDAYQHGAHRPAGRRPRPPRPFGGGGAAGRHQRDVVRRARAGVARRSDVRAGGRGDADHARLARRRNRAARRRHRRRGAPRRRAGPAGRGAGAGHDDRPGRVGVGRATCRRSATPPTSACPGRARPPTGPTAATATCSPTPRATPSASSSSPGPASGPDAEQQERLQTAIGLIDETVRRVDIQRTTSERAAVAAPAPAATAAVAAPASISPPATARRPGRSGWAATGTTSSSGGDGTVGIVIGDVVGHGIGAIADDAPRQHDPRRARARAGRRSRTSSASAGAMLDAEGMIATAQVLIARSRRRRAGDDQRRPSAAVAAAARRRPSNACPRPPMRRSASAPAAGEVVRVPFPPGSAVLGYTDGLVERRDQPIDVGIDRLAEVFASHRRVRVGDGERRAAGDGAGRRGRRRRRRRRRRPPPRSVTTRQHAAASAQWWAVSRCTANPPAYAPPSRCTVQGSSRASSTAVIAAVPQNTSIDATSRMTRRSTGPSPTSAR